MTINNRLFLFSLLLVAMLAALAPHMAHGQSKTTYEERELGFDAFDESQPDVTGLWFHIEQGQKSLANDEYGRLRYQYPSWQPSKPLQNALDRLNNLSRAKQGAGQKGASQQGASQQGSGSQTASSEKELVSNEPSSVSNAPKSPLVFFAEKTPQARRQISNTEFNKLVALAEKESLPNFYLLMGWAAIDRGKLNVARTQFESTLVLSPNEVQRRSAQQGLETITTFIVNSAIQQRDIEQLARLLASGKSNKDGGANASLITSLVEGSAWRKYNEDAYSEAYELFVLSQNADGQYLSLSAQQKHVRARQFACSIDTERFLRRCADGLAQQQLYLYEDGDYKSSIETAQQLGDIRALTLDELTLLGWAAAKYGDGETATLAFEKVLKQNPDNDVIAGELVRLNSNNRLKLNQLASTFPAVNTRRQAQVNSSAWPRKQFLLSYINADTRSTTAQTKDAFSVVSGITTRSRSGQSGLGNFDVLTSYIGIGDIYKGWQWRVFLDYKQFYSGAAPSGAWLGDDLLGDGVRSAVSNNITGFEDKGLRADIAYQDVGFNFYANVEYGMFDQPVNADITGQISATWFLPKLTLATTLFRYPKEDSMLSQTGSFNARNVDAWGYVLEDGIRGLAAYELAPRWSVAGTFQVSTMDGETVDSNTAFSVRGDVSYDIATDVSDMLDYWRVGPFASYSGYKHNRSGFTYGNGGYFSPNYFLSLGLYSELLTLEALNWQLKLSNSIALSRLEQTEDSRFPLIASSDLESDADPSVALPYSETTGLSGNFLAEAQYRIGSDWIVAGYMSKAFAVEYQAFEAGIQLRWRGGQGSGVTSDELLLSSPRLRGFAL
ncbi:cellulose synthase subunit BcsC-related outer membrane protein [Alteromonas genovensis]|uniref:cellulose synthase subunit BcsC-related outer membrane protein n=1 Tax=Alteromonas genovensis TaxID=471225 RepID=UPI002FE0D00C